MSALALYLARPLDEFSTLTSADRRALATVLRRGDVLLSAGNTRCAELVKRRRPRAVDSRREWLRVKLGT